MATADEKVFDLSVKRWRYAREANRASNDLYGRLIAFSLDLDHYRRNEGFTRDRRRIQPRTQRQFNLIRHKGAMLTRTPPHFDTHPTQPTGGMAAAEVSRRVIENTFFDPLKIYSNQRRRMIFSALAGGRGMIGLDWHPRRGVTFRCMDPRRAFCTPGFLDIHDPWNPRTVEEVPMRLSAVQAMRAQGWWVPSDLKPDNWKSDYASGRSTDTSRIELGDSTADDYSQVDEYDPEDGNVTVLKVYYRDDPIRRKTQKARTQDLPEVAWYYVDDATGQRYPFDPQNPQPPTEDARLVTTEDVPEDFYTYPQGYLCIIYPFYTKPKRPAYEDHWTPGAQNENVELSAFPYMEMPGYLHPLRRNGKCDTELTQPLTIIDDSSLRATYEQMRQAGAVLITQEGALRDSEGNQFQFPDDGTGIAIAWAKDRMSLEGTNFFQAPGMNPAMPNFRRMIDDEWSFIGTGDIAIPMQRSLDAPVGTVQALQQSGDLPVQMHAQDLGLAEAIGARVVLDMCRAYMGDNVVTWVTDAGEIAHAQVRGSDLVPLSVIVSSDPEWRQQDVDKAQAIAQFVGQVGRVAPQLLGVLARKIGIDAETAAVLSQIGEQQSAPQGENPPGQPGATATGGIPSQQ